MTGEIAMTKKNTTTAPMAVDKSSLAKVAVSGWLGTALEYIDFQLYGLAAALVFNTLFFPEIDPAAGLIASMATYGVGYFARLVGAWYFGRRGDKIGRKSVLIATIALMGGASTLIGVLPTYEQVGILAPILLMILRLFQGFGAGAEISGATVLLTEYAPPRRRGLMSSLVGLGTNCGTLLASGIWLILVNLLDNDQLLAWGWRVPFLLSFLLMGFAVLIRKHIEETPVFLNRPDVVDGVALSKAELEKRSTQDAAEKSVLEAAEQPKGRAFLLAMGLRFGQQGNSALVQTFLVGYVTTTVLVAKTVSTSAIVYASLIGFVTVPLIGLLGDRYGRRRMYQVTSITSLVVCWPLIILVNSGTPWKVTVGFIFLLNLCVLNLFSLENVTMAELFGSRSRYTQLALSKELGGSLATLIGPVVTSAACAATRSWWPIPVAMSVFSLFALVSAHIGPEVGGRDMEDLRDAV
jgi:MHS family metabolite:H+ symporter-like MFS transporter